jgi:membrane protein DedA with SNARE-associated domain
VLATEDGPGGLAGWVVDVVERIGAVGVGALIALENVFPPIPSEIILPFAGFSAAQGDVNVVAAWIAATIGALLGAWILYGVGAAIGYDRVHELAGKRWFVLFGQKDLERGERFFDRHGTQVVFFARFIPLVRSIVSVPAGMERMPLVRFSALTALGSGIWNALFIWLGYELGDRWEQVERWVQPVSYLVVVLLAAALVWLAVRKLRSVRKRDAGAAAPDDAGRNGATAG